jgi:large subunit ribosomal protein L9
MEVILREEIKGLGKAGELVKVKDGFARNFLLPQKKAVGADPKNMKQLEHQKRVAEAREKKIRKSSEDMAARLASLSITIAREAGEEDKLYGSVTSKDIADALRKEGVTIDKRIIELKEPLKQIGVFEVDVRLHHEVMAKVKVWVVKK